MPINFNWEIVFLFEIRARPCHWVQISSVSLFYDMPSQELIFEAKFLVDSIFSRSADLKPIEMVWEEQN
ncbi:hypothetical protein BpHYR1_020646 [Brachionus plicatilis]|uniref:Uncharacterized protein n=1 Tax=Brachionus plicatilis TaxID=10195 RepID=A0A3M7QD46_BRAPC|nr:hypothetical protein BpHYR1_020646 [Brachionus plicatilis]